MKRWAKALNNLPDPYGGKVLKSSPVDPMRVNPFAVWIEHWSHPVPGGYELKGGQDGDGLSPGQTPAEWAAVGTQVLDACEALWCAWGSEPVARAELLRRGVDTSLAKVVDSRRGTRHMRGEVEIWLSLGAVPSNGFNASLAVLAATPAKWNPAWRSAAALAAHGARLGTDEEAKKKLREWINCSLSEGVSAPGGMNAKERVEACLNLLGAGGWTLDSYRSKAGMHFDEMALGAVWSWTGAELAVALSQVNLTWSRAVRARVPEHAARVLSRSLMNGEAILATLTAMDAGEGLGPWSKGMERLAQQASASALRLRSADCIWWEPFGRWAVLGKWRSCDLAAAEKAFPTLVKSPVWGAAREARVLAETIEEMTTPSALTGVRGRPRPAL